MIRTLIILLALAGSATAAVPVPDDALTPGELRTGGRHAARPSLPRSVTVTVNKMYHLTGKPAEWDHRVPWGCNGATSVKNIWPQDQSKVKKDRLEHWAEAHLSVADCQKMFLPPSDWRIEYLKVFGAQP